MKRLTPKQRAERIARNIVKAMFDVNDRHHLMRHTPTWTAFRDAKQRCQNPKNKDFKHYGKRGIEFKFRSFKEFFWEVGERASAVYSLDRINNDGHYEPGNIRWATRSQQQRNKRKRQSGANHSGNLRHPFKTTR